MKMIVWIVAVLLASLWTLTAVALSSLAGWLAANAGDVASRAGEFSAWPPLEWLSLLFGPEFLPWLRSFVTGLMTWGSAAQPAAGSLLGWLEPVIWVFWALGLACLLALAGGAHFAIGRASAGARSR